LLKGETLQNRIARADGKPLPLNEQLLIAREISEALAAAHDAEIWAKYWHDWILKP